MGKMNRETKIGLAVILILLVALGAVAARRLTRPTQASATATGGDEASAVSPTAGNASGTTTATDLFYAAKPTLLSPAAVSGASRQPPDTLGQWTSATDAGRQDAGTGGATPPETPPASSAMPGPVPNPMLSPPAAGNDDRYVQSANAGQDNSALAAAPTAQSDAPRASTADTSLDANVDTAGRYPALRPAPSPSTSDPRGAEPPLGQDGTRYGPATLPAASPPPYSASTASYTDGNGSRVVVDPPPSAGLAVIPRGDEPPRRDDGTYEVQPNDNYWIISTKLYGSGAYFKALAEHNRGKVAQPDRLPVGQAILAPTIAQLEKAYPDLCPKPGRRDAVRQRAATFTTAGLHAGGRVYVVQEGDTLFDIARNELGKASRWAEILQLNRDALGKDFDYLTPGMQLSLPAKATGEPADRTASRHGTGYQR
jgi:nucleoid-associated protein YgaU